METVIGKKWWSEGHGGGRVWLRRDSPGIEFEAAAGKLHCTTRHDSARSAVRPGSVARCWRRRAVSHEIAAQALNYFDFFRIFG
ncbi:hypothetical protein LJR267_002912 [Paraburkholderia hospita]|uniref:hypothetical protein n=1 Tax=Paraburkholderia hospita TaxID=169430 RepID=UPI003ED07470